MDEMRAKRESILITKHGKRVAKLVPADTNVNDIYNFMAGKGTQDVKLAGSHTTSITISESVSRLPPGVVKRIPFLIGS